MSKTHASAPEVHTPATEDRGKYVKVLAPVTALAVAAVAWKGITTADARHRQALTLEKSKQQASAHSERHALIGNIDSQASGAADHIHMVLGIDSSNNPLFQKDKAGNLVEEVDVPAPNGGSYAFVFAAPATETSPGYDSTDVTSIDAWQTDKNGNQLDAFHMRKDALSGDWEISWVGSDQPERQWSTASRPNAGTTGLTIDNLSDATGMFTALYDHALNKDPVAPIDTSIAP